MLNFTDFFNLNTSEGMKDGLSNREADAKIRYDEDLISDALRNLADRWVPEIFQHGRISNGELRVADISGRPPRKRGSCAINLTGEHAGSWHDFSTGQKGGPISTLAEHYGLSEDNLFEQAIKIIEAYGGAGYLDRVRSQPRVTAAERDARKTARQEAAIREAAFIVSQSRHYAGTRAETYLRARGLSVMPPTGDLGFCPDCTYRRTNRGEPAMIAIFRHPDGTATGGIHRIYLREDGSWHIGEGAKMMLGPPGLVMLGGPDAAGNLGIGEGIESTAAAAEIFGVPGWAAASDGGMKAFGDWLAAHWTPQNNHGIRRLWIWADSKAAGAKAAGQLYGVARDIGLPAELFTPGGGDDFADDLKRGLRDAPPQAQLPPPSPAQPEPDIIPPGSSDNRTTSQIIRDRINTLSSLSTDDEISEVLVQVATSRLDIIVKETALKELQKKTGINKKKLEKMFKAAGKAPAISRDWTKSPDIARYDNEEPKPIMANVAIGLRGDPDWQGAFGFNEFTGTIFVLRNLPWEANPGSPCEREWTDADELAATEWFQKAGIHALPSVVYSAVARVAHEKPFHPVRDYLEWLVWDGRARIDFWLSYYLGVDDTEFARAVGARWLISAVARVMQPGCKVDTALILEGEQGIMKSTALKVLGSPWFTDQIADISTKDCAMQLHGIWIAEFAELESVNRADVAKLKAFMAQQNDRFRPPYGRQLVNFMRQNVFAGSVNENEYLRDATGGRRFWPVFCKAIDLEALEHDKDQLWAEAVYRYGLGEKWWLHEPHLQKAAKEEQEARYQADAWEGEIIKYLNNNPSLKIVTTGDILAGALLIHDRGKWTRSDQTRVGNVLRRLGWTKHRDPANGSGSRGWHYVRPIKA